MRIKSLLLIVLVIPLSSVNLQSQNDEGFIYGTVTTVDDETYTGLIRWGDEEIFWFDFFNSGKKGNEFIPYLSRKEKNMLEDRHSSWSNDWSFFEIEVSGQDFNHVFVCMFGDIKQINITGHDEVLLTFKNGEHYELEGGSNDIGATVNVLDKELGEIGVEWKRIEKIEFTDTPEKLSMKPGDPILGRIYTEHGDEFAGYIQWDNDERLDTDELDGENEDGDFSIAFSKIKSIQKHGSGSDVFLNSGRELFLKGTNDVNSENRGIIINIPDFGRVEVEWEDFKKAVFLHDHESSGPAYSDFGLPKRLAGTVYLKDESSYSGLINYDLDEKWDCELLSGDLDHIEFIIPFRYIRKIDPKNYNFSKIVLADGRKILLGDSHDVTYDNYGVMIVEDKDEHQFFFFEDIEEIAFK